MGNKNQSLQCSHCYTINPGDSQFCNKCGASLQGYVETLTFGKAADVLSDSLPEFRSGDIFDHRYRIVEEIGRGGMGRVYKADDMELNITVALKVIHPRYSSNPEFIERFKRETLTARSISHENVIRIYDLGEADHIKYISMEYIKGQNLHELIQASGRLPIDTAVAMIRQLCQALKAAHQKGIVHQDLKPSNIMIDSGGRIYIMDFGLARSIYGMESLRAGTIAGTPQYMSPEQVKGEKVDQRADIYALGSVIYEILTGRPVFEAKSRDEIMRRHIEDLPEPPAKRNSEIPPVLENIVLKCLEKQPHQRFQAVEEILFVLDRHTLKPEGLSLRRLRSQYWYAFLIIPFLLAVVFFYLLGKAPSPSMREGKRKSLAIVYLANNTGDRALDYLGKAIAELLIADLLQSQYIRVVTADKIFNVLQKVNMVEVKAFSTDDLKNIAATSGADFILNGNYARANETLLVNTYLYDARTLEPIGLQRKEGKGADSIFNIVDGLSRGIKEDFKLRPEEIAKDIDKDIVQITTASPQALQLYIEGKTLFNLGKLTESLATLKKAVALDPGFAVAFRKLAEVCVYQGLDDEANAYLNKAVSLLNRVSERDYYIIQGMAAGSNQLAIENYKKLLELYPDDLEANGLLGSLYRNIEEWTLAQERFEKIIAVDHTQDLAYDNLAHIYMANGLYAKARNVLESRQDFFTDKVQYHLRLGMTYMCEGRFDAALKEGVQALAVDKDNLPVTEMRGHIFQLMGAFDAAEETYRRMTASSDFVTQYMGRHWLCYLYLAKGQFERMNEEIRQGLEYSRKADFKPGIYNFNLMQTYSYLQDNRLSEALEAANHTVEVALESKTKDYIEFAHHIRGIVYVKRGQLEEARSTAEKIKHLVEERALLKHLRHYHHLEGEIALREGHLDQAIENFQTAIALLPAESFKADIHILFLDSLAQAYFQKSAWKKAEADCRRIVSLTTGRLRWADKYALGFFRLGEICRKQGKKEEAVESLQKFLSLWNRTDPNRRPEVGTALRLLSELGKPVPKS